LDLEDPLGTQSAAQVAQAALTFLQHVEALSGRKPLMYTSPSYFTQTLKSPAGFDSYVLWIAHWQVTCPNIPQPPWQDWAIWQRTSTGAVDGIKGMVDLDEFNGTLSDLQMWLNPTPADDGGAPDLAEVVDAANPAD